MSSVGLEFASAVRAHSNSLVIPLQRLVIRQASGLQDHVRQQLETAIELLAASIESDGPDLAGQQFGGWMKIVVRQSPDRFIDKPFTPVELQQIWSAWRDVLRTNLSKQGLAALDTVTLAAERLLHAAPGKVVRVLFIGDCLLWDASLHLQIQAHADDTMVDPTIMVQRIGVDLRRELLKAKSNDFDLVIYSPYTYEFSGEYAFASSALNFIRAPIQRFGLLEKSLADVKKTIDTITERFDCPLYVHTVSGAVQLHEGWLGTLKYYLNSPARAMAAKHLNRGLTAYIDKQNQSLDRPIARIDERNVRSDLSLRVLGLIAYDAGELHPTRMAAELARTDYFRSVQVFRHFAGKKLIVCDLDNTLWDGTIGEGAVLHHLDRQETLKSLKSRGIVLAIASKNDPKNVTWQGGTLNDDDFVAKQINWGQKSTNILTMARQLNLKPSSFVFLDDRPDEREMVISAIPDLLAMDPNEPETWLMLQHWYDSIPRSSLTDRTRMYQNRAQRQEVLDTVAPNTEDVAESYRSLNLQLSLRHPDSHEMTRVVELINRTNQFNTTGTRTTRQEMTSGLDHRRILIADVRDKFGEMGIVGVLVLELGNTWQITHFVLSCRAFGFGIEDSMLNAVNRWTDGRVAIVARLIETPVNEPCRDVYARNGFRKCNDNWLLEPSVKITDPSWLTIDDATNPSEFPLSTATE